MYTIDDLTKVFDRGTRHHKSPKEAPANIVTSVYNFNTNNRTQIKARENITSSIPTPEGIRQGDSPSPFLFNLLMDKIIEVTSLNRMNNGAISMVCYADDTAIFAE